MFLKQQQDSQQKKTLLLTINDVVSDADKLSRAAAIIRRGGLVAFPTETVYGLGANALDPQAVKGIFAAKGRPQDNPLIIHLYDPSQTQQYAKNIPPVYYALCERFSPGPLTVILPKRDCIPMETSGGLDTVAVRIPSHPVAREIIRLAGVDATVSPCTSAEYKAKHPESADRPHWSALDNRALRCSIGNQVRPWQEALACFFQHWDGDNGMKD